MLAPPVLRTTTLTRASAVGEPLWVCAALSEADRTAATFLGEFQPGDTVRVDAADGELSTLVGLLHGYRDGLTTPQVLQRVLKVDATNLPTIPWGDSSKLKVAEWVLHSRGKIRADKAHEKLLALGYEGSERTTRRAVCWPRWKSGVSTSSPTPTSSRLPEPAPSTCSLSCRSPFPEGPRTDDQHHDPECDVHQRPTWSTRS